MMSGRKFVMRSHYVYFVIVPPRSSIGVADYKYTTHPDLVGPNCRRSAAVPDRAEPVTGFAYWPQTE